MVRADEFDVHRLFDARNCVSLSGNNEGGVPWSLEEDISSAVEVAKLQIFVGGIGTREKTESNLPGSSVFLG